LRVLVTGGGTGGHLYPALSIMETLEKKRKCDFLFIGTQKGIESKVIPMKRYPFQTIWISGLYRRKLIENLLFPVKLFVALIHSIFIVHRFYPDMVLGTGGYVSWPVLTAALILKKRTIIQEQNMYPGLVTKLLAPHVDGVYLSYESSVLFLKRKSNLHVVGNPIRKNLVRGTPKEGYRHFGLKPNWMTIFIFGGSQGARGINLAILSILDKLMTKANLQLLWATGSRWIVEVQQKTRTWEKRIKVMPFIHGIHLAYAISDLVICRSGATTIAEIAQLGLPALLIPYPAAARNHQEKNARMLCEKGAAEMVLESELDSKKLDHLIITLLENHQKRDTMRKNIKKFANPEAAEVIVKAIIKDVENPLSEPISN
jgi:UDP-N-acetylglucosamine--N-acetylmuramyl-(pentapeptide) pyrophosphoryl-undecaprenol N-acetylglucosamine transferase